MKRQSRAWQRVGLAGALVLLGVACQDRSTLVAPEADADHREGDNAPLLYVAQLTPLNNSGVRGAAAFAIHNGELTARVYATGMAPNQLHPQHIHGLPNFENSTCPAPGAANRIPGLPENVQNPDRLIAFEEGLPDYGEIRVPLDGQLNATAELSTFPTANAQGVVNYLQKTSFASLQEALGDFELLPLEEKAVVLHGGFVTGEDGEQVYVATLPVACAQIRMTEETELRQKKAKGPSQIISGGPTVGLELVADNLSNPVTLEEAPDGSGRLFIVEQIGRIRILMPDGTLREEPFLDVRDRMVDLMPDFDERGLLGLAFHPHFADNGRFFVYYNAPPRIPGYNNTSVVSEFRVEPGSMNATPQFVREVITEDQPQFNHNGGTITFGPDGYLYIAWGDGGGRDDEGGNPFTAPLRNTPVFGHVDDWYERNAGGNGQDIEQNLLGSILRIDVNGGTPYAIPFDNPFVGKPGRDEIYAYGLRNPYRMSFDMGGNHALYAGDAGQDMWEEISIITKGGNYGWNVKEGTHCFDAEEPRTIPEECPSVDPTTGIPLTDPVIELVNHHNPFFHGVGTVIIGGYVYRGNDVPQLKGQYIFGIASTGHDAAAGVLFVAKPRNPNRAGVWPVQRVQVTNVPGEHQDGHGNGHGNGHGDGHEGGQLNGAVLGFGQDLRGEVYVLTSKSMGPEGTTGQVLKFVRTGGGR